MDDASRGTHPESMLVGALTRLYDKQPARNKERRDTFGRGEMEE